MIGQGTFRTRHEAWSGKNLYLEHKLQPELNQAWVAVRIRGRHLSKAVCASGNKIRAGEAELRVVE